MGTKKALKSAIKGSSYMLPYYLILGNMRKASGHGEHLDIGRTEANWERKH